MLNAEIYKHPPQEFKLLNDGVAKVSDNLSGEKLQTLRYELKTFVCEGQYESGLRRILDSYLKRLGEPSQPAVWVSGFFGSGKSHLVKVLRYLWVDFAFPEDGQTARGLAESSLPHEVRAHLAELSTAGRRRGGLHAASGTLGASAGDSVRLAVLSIVFQSVGLPESYPRARFVMRLRQEGLLEAVRERLSADGADFERELRNLRASSRLAKAVHEVDGSWGADPREVRESIRAEYDDVSDVSSAEMLATLRDALALATDTATADNLPCTLIALDEVQQYIGDDTARGLAVQETVETIAGGMEGRVLIVCTGQSALNADTPLLSKLTGRFTLKVHLSDADVETVTRKTVLAKTNGALPAVEGVLQASRGEIDRHLQGTKLRPRSEDLGIEVADYPVLPTRRRFWERVIQSRGNQGTDSQLRNQLKVIDEAVKTTANAPLGTVVGGDFVYDRESLLQSGELPQEIDARIERLRRDGDPLDARLAALAWLIGRLPRESGADTGLRGTAEVMADLLVEDLTASSAALRGRIEARLKALEEAGELMQPVAGEYRMQTTQSAEWEQAYRTRLAAIRNDAGVVATDRNDRLRKRAHARLEALGKLTHGRSKTARTIRLSYGEGRPQSDGTSVPVWVRSGWEVSAEAVRTEAAAEGAESPLVFVHLPERSADTLNRALAAARAARETLDTRGVPTEPEGREARKAMQTRLDGAEADAALALSDVFAGARVFLAGGSEETGATLEDAVTAAAGKAFDRLFPEFGMADDLRWSTVYERAKKGSTAALEAVDHKGKPDAHPVCAEVVRVVGGGKTGKDLKAYFEGAPFGWPADVLPGALALLVRVGMLKATRDGQPVGAEDLDARGLIHVRFQVEDERIELGEQLALAKLMQNADGMPPVKPTEVAHHAGEFLRAMRAMAVRAGGEPPLPAVPSPPVLAEAEGTTGNAQLRLLYDRRNDLTELMNEWGTLASRTPSRVAEWKRLQRALAHANGLAEAEPARAEAEAVRQQRTLLADSDPLDGLVSGLVDALRAALAEARDAYAKTHARERASLEADDAWQALDASQQADVLDRHGLAEVPTVSVGTDDQVLASLDALPLGSWRDRTAGLPTRFRTALAEAAAIAEPAAPPPRPVALRSTTLRSADDVEAWLDEARGHLLEAVGQGPVIV